MLALSMLSILIANAQFCTTREGVVHQSRVSRIDTSSLAGIGDDLGLWATGKHIRVGFFNGTPAQQERLLAIAREWEQYANISFVTSPVENAHVRVLLANSRANYTFVGKDILKVMQGQPNMQIDLSLFEGGPQRLTMVVLHQFGHVLGMTHEHDAPEGGIQWDHKAVIKAFGRLGWQKGDVEANIFDLYTHRMANGFFYDALSIMHWAVPGRFTKNGYSFEWNGTLSAGDKAWAASQYPFSKPHANLNPPVFTTGAAAGIGNFAPKK